MKISLTLNGSIILKVKTVQTADFGEHFNKELTEFMLQWFAWSGGALPSLCGRVTLVALEAASALQEKSQKSLHTLHMDHKRSMSYPKLSVFSAIPGTKDEKSLR